MASVEKCKCRPDCPLPPGGQCPWDHFDCRDHKRCVDKCDDQHPSKACLAEAAKKPGETHLCEHNTYMRICDKCGESIKYSGRWICSCGDKKLEDEGKKHLCHHGSFPRVCELCALVGEVAELAKGKRRVSRDESSPKRGEAKTGRRSPSRKVIEAMAEFVITDDTCCLTAWPTKPKPGTVLALTRKEAPFIEEYEEIDTAVLAIMACLTGAYSYACLKHPGRRDCIEIEWRDNDWFYTMDGDTLNEARAIEYLKL